MNKITRLLQTAQKPTRQVIGLMTGMSRDGIDLAHAEISGVFPNLVVKLKGSATGDFSENTKDLLHKGEAVNAYEITLLNRSLAEDLAAAVNQFLQQEGLASTDIDLIGSHGQTLVHIAPEAGWPGSTLQVGSASIIAELTDIPTVGNFRIRDMIRGGHGAPLIPMVDYILYRQQVVAGNAPVALNNLGSISNLTIVTLDLADCMAFDTGPANMPIDFFARDLKMTTQLGMKCTGIDTDGTFSAQGQVIDEMLDDLLALPYFKKQPPKSAGYQEFGPGVLREISSRYTETQLDKLATAVEFSAETIAQAYEQFVAPSFPALQKIIFTGGGAYNKTLLKRIRERLPQYTVESMAESDPALNDVKEALGFAILGDLTMQGQWGNVKSATGADRDVILGEIAP